MNKRTSTKQKLLNILKKDNKRTIREIMDYFTISEIAVRRHIHELVHQGFIKRKAVKQKIGRPYHTYELTGLGHRTFPNQYEALPLELLRDLEELQGKEAVKALLKKRMEREEAFFQEKMKLDTFDQRVAKVASIQDERGYMVEYDRLDNGDFKMKNFNCPIINIASDYQHICRNEKQMLANVLQSNSVDSKSCIATGDTYCQWIIKNPNSH